MRDLPHLILEVANNHGGDVKTIKNLIERYSQLNYGDLGVKFQAFKYDKMAMNPFKWYSVYEELFIDKEDWRDIIELAHKMIGKVWLDIFCVHGLEVLGENLGNIWGIKLQPSVVYNHELLEALRKMDLSEKEFIINLSGYELTEIESLLTKFSNFNFKKTVLQIGFQCYPTSIEDTSLRKIAVLRQAFPDMELSFADHLSAEDSFSQRFPVYAYLQGCDYIEKHACLSREESKYDQFSSLHFEEVEEILKELRKVNECLKAPFLPESELNYLETTFQKPIIHSGLNAGQLVSNADLIFRRTDKAGLKHAQISNLQNQFHILKHAKQEDDTLSESDYKKARIGVIVAARLKSTRLKGKAMLPIEGVESVQRCLEICLKFPFADEVILATSDLKEDEPLKEFCKDTRIKFYQGHPSDVVSRFWGASQAYDLDIVIRVTADCPVVSAEIAEVLLKSHFQEGADYTEAAKFAVGTNSEIFNAEALKRVVEYIGEGNGTAYLGWYMVNNPQIFKVNSVHLPDQYVRDYRVTLDYKEDLDMFNELFRKLNEEGLEPSLENIFNVLDHHPEIVKINADKPLIYEVDQDLIKRLTQKTTFSGELLKR